MRILGIETSCDETAAAVVENGRRVQSNVIASSKDVFARMGGVIPEDAARRQVECILPVIGQALEGIGKEAIDAIAVTRGPGLLGSLLVGTTTARTLAALWEKPLIGVHHTLGHLSSTWLDAEGEPQFPLLTLSVSGGHTELWLRESHTRGTLLGRTRDDAAGEAFDKGASLLGLPYPGGPSLAALAAQGNSNAYPFPLPLSDDPSLDWSFSGLKTALRYLMRDTPDAAPADLAASYEHGLCRHLCDRVERALNLHAGCRELHVVGGVSANRHLRTMLEHALPANVTLRHPRDPSYCTDNGAMIAAAGFFLHTERNEQAFVPFETEATTPLSSVIL